MPNRTATEVREKAASTGGQHIVRWVDEVFGGAVVSIERLPRWRAAWWFDVERDGQLLHLYARGDRGPDFPSPFSLDYELAVHQLFEDHGIPAPHAYGIIDDAEIRTLVMDRVPGQQGLALADEGRRQPLLLECIDLMVRTHAIDLAELSSRGFPVPTSPGDTALSGAITNVEQVYLARQHPLDPATEFLRRWLRRNAPDKVQPAFVTWDSAQFLHDDGRLTALIDFELAHVGDALMDLAPLRSRDTIEPLGDLSVAFARYADLTGAPIDFDLLRYYEISQLTTSIMLAYCTLADPDPETDLVSHMTWYSDSTWYALDVLAELHGTTVARLEVPAATPSPRAAAHRHLVGSLRRRSGREPVANLVRFGIDVQGRQAAPVTAPADDGYLAWRSRCDYRLARHLARADEIGPALERQDIADVEAFVGTTQADRAGADAALVDAIVAAGPERDLELVQLLGRRAQRFHMMLGPADSLVTRHPALQPMPRGVGAR